MPTAVAKVSRRSRAQEIVPLNVKALAAAPVAWPFDHWLGLQAALFKASEPVLIGWIGRRCAGATALLDSFAGLARCDDLNAAAAIHATWLEGAMGRLEADARALAEEATAISHCLANSAESATETVWQGPERRSPSRPWSKKPEPAEPPPAA